MRARKPSVTAILRELSAGEGTLNELRISQTTIDRYAPQQWSLAAVAHFRVRGKQASAAAVMKEVHFVPGETQPMVYVKDAQGLESIGAIFSRFHGKIEAVA